MKISIDELRNLPQQKIILQFRETIEDCNAVKPVLGDLTASANSIGIKLAGNLQTLLKLTCHRCLRPYFHSLSLHIDESFVESNTEMDDKSSSRDRELLADDFVEELPDDGVLDITDVVYQAVTLATPVTCLCGDDCPGPAFPGGETKSGSLAEDKEPKRPDDRIDPRWKNLKTLFPNEESDKKS